MKTRPWISLSDLDDSTHPDANNIIMAASSVLFALSGQKYAGVQRATEHYICEPSGAPVGCEWDAERRLFKDVRTDEVRFLIGGLKVSGTNTRFRLRGTPVQDVEEVSLGGTVLDPSQYRVLDRSLLESVGGSWNPCSDDGVKVTYTFGVAPPPLGVMAASRLANEMLAAVTGGECALPMSVTSVSRQGLSFEIFDPQAFFDKGRTGLYEVDLFIATANPSNAKKRARVFTPDTPRGYRRS